MEALERANRDLNAFIDALPVGVLVLNRELRLDRVTPSVVASLNISPADQGKPFAHLVERLGAEDLLADARHVLQQGNTREREVRLRGAAANWYLVQLRPYRTTPDCVDGVVIAYTDITKLKETQARLVRNQERLQVLFENIRCVLLLADNEGHFVDCNTPAVETLGYDRKEILQMRVADLLCNAEPEEVEQAWGYFLETGTMEGEYEVRRKDGSIAIMEYHAVAHILPGLHVSMLCDVTERRAKEQALKQQAKIIGEIHDGVIITDLNGVITSVNRGAELQVGYTADELLGRHIATLYPEASRATLQEQLIAPLKEHGSLETESTVLRKSGEPMHAHLSLALLRDDEGVPTGMVGYAIDITERIATERALAAANERIQQILESISEGFLVVDNDDRLVYVNDRAATLWDVQQKDLIGRNVLDIFPEGGAEPFRNAYLKAVETREPTTIEARYSPLERWFVADLYPFADGVTVYFRDVTEQKRLEQEILRIQEEEQRRIGRDLHDGLASLLTGLAMLGRGIANRIERDEPVDLETVEELIRQARSGAEQARSLAHGLNPVKLEEQGLEAALRELCSTVQVLSNVSCSCIVDEELPDLSGVEHHLYRIAQEAALNAVRHARGNRIELRLQAEREGVVLTIHDDGVGIGGGATDNGGMGLHTMRYRAHLIGATLAVESAPEGGTDVVCRLPYTYLTVSKHTSQTDVK